MNDLKLIKFEVEHQPQERMNGKCSILPTICCKYVIEVFVVHQV